MTDERLSRKRFIDWALRLGGLAAAGSVLYPTVRYLSPIQTAGANGPVELTDDELAKIKAQQFVITKVGTRKILILRDSQGAYRAVDAKCTHEGCTVAYLPAQQIISCGCHNGRFDLDGRILGGPPPKPLVQHDVVADASGKVIVTVKAS